MSALILASAAMPMTSSIKLLDFVNEARAEFKESAVRHNDFLARCRDELDGEVYETFVHPPEGFRPATQAIRMTIDQCKLVAMRESKGVRRRVLARLNELEAKVAQPAIQIPTTLAGALRLAAEQAEQLEQKNEQLALAAPKIEVVDRYVDSTGLKGFREVAKLLGANEARFREFLECEQIMYRLNGKLTAYQNHIKAGRFCCKTGTNQQNGHSFVETKFTSKGLEWIAGLWAVHQLHEDRDGLPCKTGRYRLDAIGHKRLSDLTGDRA